MIFLDTNIIVRLIVNDNPEQRKLAVEFMEQVRDKKISAFLEDSVVLEILQVTTSKKLYNISKDEVVARLVPVISLENVYHSYKNELVAALEKYADTNLDFVDCLALAYKDSGLVEKIFSFDKKLT